MGMQNLSGQGAAPAVPQEIKGWNWGAFLLNWIWSIGNQTWIGLLALIPYAGFVMAIVLGVKGNEWAWQNRQWASIQQFKTVQRIWAYWGLALLILGVMIGIMASVISYNSTVDTLLPPAVTPQEQSTEPVPQASENVPTYTPKLEMRKGDWSWHQEADQFVIAEGRVKNISNQPLDQVEAIVTWEAADGTFITTEDALVDYQPILAGQASPWKVIGTWNPAMKSGKASVQFKELMGGSIDTKMVD